MISARTCNVNMYRLTFEFRCLRVNYIYVRKFYIRVCLLVITNFCTGGLDSDHLCPVDYRTELREAKARVDRPAHRVILDEFGYSLDLLLHALESQLKETGLLLCSRILNDLICTSNLNESSLSY